MNFPRAYRLTVHCETRTFVACMSLSIIHVARKLITRPIHCGFVNLFDGSDRSGRSGACRPILLSLSLSLCLPTANLPRSFVGIARNVLGNVLSQWRRERRSPYDFRRTSATDLRNIICSGNWREMCLHFWRRRGFSFSRVRICHLFQGENLPSFLLSFTHRRQCLVSERFQMRRWANCGKYFVYETSLRSF